MQLAAFLQKECYNAKQREQFADIKSGSKYFLPLIS